jgi:hypothetical protein
MVNKTEKQEQNRFIINELIIHYFIL